MLSSRRPAGSTRPGLRLGSRRPTCTPTRWPTAWARFSSTAPTPSARRSICTRPSGIGSGLKRLRSGCSRSSSSHGVSRRGKPSSVPRFRARRSARSSTATSAGSLRPIERKSTMTTRTATQAASAAALALSAVLALSACGGDDTAAAEGNDGGVGDPTATLEETLFISIDDGENVLTLHGDEIAEVNYVGETCEQFKDFIETRSEERRVGEECKSRDAGSEV